MEVDFYRFPEEVQKVIYNVKPGITGIGSVIFRDEEKYLSRPDIDPISCYETQIAPYKGALELWYQEHASLAVDFRIIFLTAWVIIFPESELPYRWFRDLPSKPEWMAKK